MALPTVRESPSRWTRLRRAGHSVRAKFLALLLLAVVLPLEASLVQVHSDAMVREAEAYQRAAQTANLAEDQVAELVGRIQRLAYVGQFALPVWEDSVEARSHIAGVWAASDPAITVLGFFDNELQSLGSSRFQAGRPLADYRARGYAREAVATGKLAVSGEALLGMSTGRSVMALALPIRESMPPHRTIFLAAGLRLDRLYELWNNIQLPAGSTLMLVDDRGGQILADTHPTAPRIGTAMQPAAFAILRAGSEPYLVTPPDGVERLRAWAPVRDTPWVVVVDTPRAVVVDPIYDEARQRAAWAVALSVGIFALLAVPWRRFGRGLQQLEGAAARWAAGDLACRTQLRGNDEVGLLGLAFDRMAAELQSATQRAALAAAHEAAERERSARLEGVTLAAREVAHRLNGDLALTISAAELLQLHLAGDARAAALIADLLQGAQRAAVDIARLQRVTRVATWDTPVGPALDLDRSTAATLAGAAR